MEEMGLAVSVPCLGLAGRAWQQVPAVAFPRLAMLLLLWLCSKVPLQQFSSDPGTGAAWGVSGVVEQFDTAVVGERGLSTRSVCLSF